jgi:hypothetical protein
MTRDETWTLHRRDDGQLLAHLTVTGGDFPWLNARADPQDGFELVRPLFLEDLRLIDGVDDQPDAWERAYEAIRSAVTLRYPDGTNVPEFLLHIDGHDAWWRWSDTPFDEDA